MKSGKLIYKCRRCGETFVESVPKKTAKIMKLAQDKITALELGIIPPQVGTHNCKDGKFAVADLIGVRKR